MSVQVERWATWRELLQSCPPGPESVERAFEDLAVAVSASLGQLPPFRRWWDAAGIRVEERSMRGRGRCDTSRFDHPVVLVNVEDNRSAQAFTVAHEVAHLLIDQLPIERRRELGYRRMEELCDEFARKVLVPPARLRAELGPQMEAPTLAETLRLCGVFGANPSAVLRALDHQVPLLGKTYLLAPLRGHFRRPSAVAFRVDTTAGSGKVFWPRHIRIAKLGLVELAEEAARARHGSHFAGRDSRVVIRLERLDQRTGHNSMAGPVNWQAVRQGKDVGYLLALLDTSELQAVRVTGKKARKASSPASTLPVAISA